MLGPSLEEIVQKITNNEIRPILVEFYAPDIGYAVTLPGLNCVDKRTELFSYKEDYELLQDIENGELPTALIDLIENFCAGRVFYKNCLVVQVEDKRKIDAEVNILTDFDVNYTQPKYFCLRPTARSLRDDLNRILGENLNLSVEQKCRLENEFWKLNSENLTFEQRSAENEESALPWRRVTENVRYFTNKKRKLTEAEIECVLINEFRFAGLLKLSAKRVGSDSRKPGRLITNSNFKSTAESRWKLMLPSQKTAGEISEKRLQPAVTTGDNNETIDLDEILTEEYLIEFPAQQQTTSVEGSAQAPPPRYSRTKIVIKKKKIDFCYFGELTIERDPLLDLPPVKSTFTLGSEWNARVYVGQYLEMVSEGGRRPLTLTRLVPGKPPQTMSRSSNKAAAIGSYLPVNVGQQPGDFLANH